MNDKRIKLDNALRRAMLQRTVLKRKLGMAGQELAPDALVKRGKRRVGEKVDEATLGAQQQLKRYRLPLTIAAIAGIGYALRRPIQTLGPKLWDELQSLTGFGNAPDEVDDDAQTNAVPPPSVENDDEEF